MADVSPPDVPQAESAPAVEAVAEGVDETLLAKVVPADIAEGATPDPTNVFRNRTFTDTQDLAAVSRQEQYVLTSSAGKELNVTTWHPVGVQQPRGIVILVHGYLHKMDHQWHAWASEFNALGLLTVGFNQPGMGSPGIPGFCESLDEYVSNTVDITRHAVALGGGAWSPSGAPTVPVVVYGQSMGGAITINAVRRHSELFVGAVLSAPMCGIAPDRIPNCCAIGVLRCLESCMPTAALVPDGDVLGDCFKCKDQLAHVRSKGEEDKMPKQPLLRTGLELYDGTLDIQEHVADFAPQAVLLVQGEDDIVTDKGLTSGFIRDCTCPDKTHISYGGTWHAMEWDNVDTRQRFVHDVTRWVAVRLDAWEAANPTLSRAPGAPAQAAAEEGAAGEGDAVLAPSTGDGKEEEGALADAPAVPASAAVAAAPHTSQTVEGVAPQEVDPATPFELEGGVRWVKRPAGVGPVPRHDDNFVVIPGTNQLEEGEGASAAVASQ